MTTEQEMPFNPLEQEMVERPYSTPTINPNDTTPIGAPVFKTPPPESEQSDSSANPVPEKGDTNQSNVNNERPPLNPATSTLSRKEQEKGAVKMAQAAIKTYAQIWGFVGKNVGIPRKKYAKAIVEGEINPNLVLDLQTGQKTINDFVTDFNEECEDQLTVDEDFKTEVEPVLVEIFIKNGIAMTPEQNLAYIVGQDLAVKAVTIATLSKVGRDILAGLKQTSENAPQEHHNYANNTPPTPPTPPNNNNTPPSPENNNQNNGANESDYLTQAEQELNKEKIKSESGEPTIISPPIPGNKEFNIENAETGRINAQFEPNVRPNNMPQFGDKTKLAQMAEVAAQGTAVPKRSAKVQINKGDKTAANKGTAKKNRKK